MGLSKRSIQKLNTCHSDLIKLIEAVAEDEAVMEEAQEEVQEEA